MRKLAEGYERVSVAQTQDATRPIAAFIIRQAQSWYEPDAPPECFAVPDPAPDDALKGGLVEAEAEPEPERPEPKFTVVGQVVNWWNEDNNTGAARIVSEPGWCCREWRYTVEVLSDANGPVEPFTDVVGERSNTLSTHTMSIQDVPDEVLVAIMRGEPVRVVDVPVTKGGVPYSEQHGRYEADWVLRGKTVRAGSGDYLHTKAPHIRLYGTDRVIWPWNLVPTTPGE